MSESSEPLPLRVATAVDDADRDVLVRVAAGELDALEELYDRYKTMAYSIAYRITNDASLAEDVVQDAFLGAWRNAAKYVEGRGSVKTWLLSIVHHRAIDAIRRRRPTSELPESTEAPPAALTEPDIWAEVAAGLDAEMVRGAMDVLSPPQREAIELAYFSGLTQHEIAERTGAPLGTVKSRMRLGLLAMRQVPRGGRRWPRCRYAWRRAMSDPVRPTELTCDDVREMAGSFVLGALPDAEAAAVRAHLASCADAHAEIAELGSVLPVLDASVPHVEPPAGTEGSDPGGGRGRTPARRPAPLARSDARDHGRSGSRPPIRVSTDVRDAQAADLHARLGDAHRGGRRDRRPGRLEPAAAGPAHGRAAVRAERGRGPRCRAATGSRGRDPLAGRRHGLGHRGHQRGRRHHDGHARPRPDERRPGLRGVGHRRRRRAGRRSAASRWVAAGRRSWMRRPCRRRTAWSSR